VQFLLHDGEEEAVPIIKIEFAGKHFFLNSVDGTDLVAHQLQTGQYEAPLPFVMMATYLHCEGLFVDIGANSGIYTVMAGALNHDRRIVAFEPLPELIAVFKHNVAINALSQRVTLHESALSDTTGKATLYLPDPSHGLLETSASLEAGFKDVHSSITVPITTLDEMSIEDEIAVIKIDIEGHEYACLRGARETIRKNRPFIFAEVVGPAKRGFLTAFLAEIGYLDFRLRPDLAIHDGDVVFDNGAWNHAFVPAERLERFKEACDSCNVLMLRRFKLS
jgi:FkbM family methyltransferase